MKGGAEIISNTIFDLTSDNRGNHGIAGVRDLELTAHFIVYPINRSKYVHLSINRDLRFFITTSNSCCTLTKSSRVAPSSAFVLMKFFRLTQKTRCLLQKCDPIHVFLYWLSENARNTLTTQPKRCH